MAPPIASYPCSVEFGPEFSETIEQMEDRIVSLGRAMGIAADAAMMLGGQVDAIRQQDHFSDAALRRAEMLLIENLSREQFLEWQARRAFSVRSQTGRKYIILCRSTGNVLQVDEHNRILQTFCIVPASSVPIYDQLLMQKLMLECDEYRFLMTANRGVFTASLDAPGPEIVFDTDERGQYWHGYRARGVIDIGSLTHERRITMGE
jgi:hypothetical protein